MRNILIRHNGITYPNDLAMNSASRIMPSNDDRYQKRKRPARGVIEIAGQPTIVFDTVCTKDRARWLACDEVHQLLVEIWTDASAWLVGRYMIMPAHIHFFAGHRDGATKYENWVKYWKSRFTKKFQRPECRWQVDDFDHRVRSAASYEQKWEYVRENPVRCGLVENSDDWPYQGEIHELRWE